MLRVAMLIATRHADSARCRCRRVTLPMLSLLMMLSYDVADAAVAADDASVDDYCRCCCRYAIDADADAAAASLLRFAMLKC